MGSRRSGGTEFNADQIVVNVHGDYVSGDAHGAAGGRPLTREEKRSLETRHKLIGAVRAVWIAGVLKPAIENEMYIELKMLKRRDVLAQPVHRLLPDEEPLPEDMSVRDVFEAHQQKLLILGEPASGKTTTLLRLADDLLAVAEGELNTAVPVIVNLASWAEKREALADWLAEELFNSYQMAKETGKAWATSGQLMLFLDGLDEVAEAHRTACLEAINDFQASYAAPLVVCSRFADYKKLEARLNVAGAIYLETLSAEQIDAYLAQFGNETAGIREAVQQDEVWRELANSPLMLSLMPLALAGQPAAQILSAERESAADEASVAAGRERLLEAYVAQAFARKPLDEAKTDYNQEQALGWLAFVAQGLYAHNETFFFLEKLNKAWLPNTRTVLIFGMIFGLPMGMILGLIFGLIIGHFDPILGMIIAIASGPMGGLIAGVSIGFSKSYRSWVDSFAPLIIRFLLARRGLLHFWLGDFLDEMAERWLLRRVGGGWVFRHRYFLEYFAARSPVKLDKTA